MPGYEIVHPEKVDELHLAVDPQPVTDGMRRVLTVPEDRSMIPGSHSADGRHHSLPYEVTPEPVGPF